METGGRLGREARGARGVTLLEMMVVVALIAVMIGVTFPAIASGIESLRLRTASDEVVAALNSALTRADRLQEAVLVTVSAKNRAVFTQTVRTNVMRRVDLPDGVSVARVLPGAELAEDQEAANQPDRFFFIYPDGSVPQITIDLVNTRGFHRLVAVDPITGVAREQALAAAAVAGGS